MNARSERESPTAPAAETTPPAVPATTISLELELPPDAAGRLTRHKAIAAARSGRGRGAGEELIYLDTADGRLAAAGLALEAPKRGPRHLLESLPPPGALAWPGAPPAARPIDALAAQVAEAPLVPLVAFTGRRMQVPLADGILATLRHGRLRSVADEAPVARLSLTGAPGAVFRLARHLAADLPLLAPRASLAETGRGLALATPLRPRRRGAPDLAGTSTAQEALAFAIGHLGEALLFHSAEAAAGHTPEGVHQLRVAARRLRSLLRVFRGAELVHAFRRVPGGCARCCGCSAARSMRRRCGRSMPRCGCWPISAARRATGTCSWAAWAPTSLPQLPPPGRRSGSMRCSVPPATGGQRPTRRCARGWRRRASGCCCST
jgi:hypothetical protein